MKAAVLDRDPDVPNLVAVSYYDQEPVHFLSTTCESIHWIQCQKQVYCSETQRLQSRHGWRRHCRSTPKLLQFQPLDEEKEVVVVNIFWAFVVLLVNAYVSYKTYMISKGKWPMSHYEFRKQIALA